MYCLLCTVHTQYICILFVVYSAHSRNFDRQYHNFPLHNGKDFNPLNAELNPICHLLALLGSATIVVVNRISVKHAVRYEFTLRDEQVFATAAQISQEFVTMKCKPGSDAG
jgi:hypothetical protein